MSDSSSLDYWRARWAAAPMDYATSWPDEYARRLELLYLKKNLPEKGLVLEIGCGALGLAEEPALVKSLRGRYLGLDGSEEALIAAHRRVPGNGFEFRAFDLVAGVDNLPLSDFILSKRVLQNISPSARGSLLKKVFSYPHGILIEDCAWAREETNRMRAVLGRGPLSIPEFNYPLSGPEIMRAGHVWHVWRGGEAFMGYFYGITRVFPDLPRAGFEAGFTLSQHAILADVRQPLFGPVIALRW